MGCGIHLTPLQYFDVEYKTGVTGKLILAHKAYIVETLKYIKYMAYTVEHANNDQTLNFEFF